MSKPIRRTNAERSQATRAALVTAARELFLANGYAATATPEIVSSAKMTRGALYHHFRDKSDLFHAVIDAESAAVAESIQSAIVDSGSPLAALFEGADAYFEAMAQPGRARLLLIEAPAVLGSAELAHIDRRHGAQSLSEGLAAALAQASVTPQRLQALSDMLSAGFERAALAIAIGEPGEAYRLALRDLIGGLVANASQS